jgi:hypothetical protein
LNIDAKGVFGFGIMNGPVYNEFRTQVKGLGYGGKTCYCPDGQSYFSADELDPATAEPYADDALRCSGKACENGTTGNICHKLYGPWSKTQTVCDINYGNQFIVKGKLSDDGTILEMVIMSLRDYTQQFYVGRVNSDEIYAWIDGQWKDEFMEWHTDIRAKPEESSDYDDDPEPVVLNTFRLTAVKEHLPPGLTNKGHKCICPTIEGFVEMEVIQNDGTTAKECINCHMSCRLCLGTVTACTACHHLDKYPGASDVNLKDGACRIRCKQGFYLEPATLLESSPESSSDICMGCGNPCSVCTGPLTSDCHKDHCNHGYTWREPTENSLGKCRMICETGEYFDEPTESC